MDNESNVKNVRSLDEFTRAFGNDDAYLGAYETKDSIKVFRHCSLRFLADLIAGLLMDYNESDASTELINARLNNLVVVDPTWVKTTAERRWMRLARELVHAITRFVEEDPATDAPTISTNSLDCILSLAQTLETMEDDLDD